MKEYFLRTYAGKPQPLGKAIYGLYPDLPYALVSRLLKQKDVFLDGVRAREDALISAGQEVNLYCRPNMIKISVVYRDDDILVLYKPKGIASDGQYSFETLSEYVFGDNLRLLHRLDTNTDGLLMFAANSQAYDVLYRVNSEHRITKGYVARVYGAVEDEATLDGYLAKDSAEGRVRIYHEPNKGAEYVRCTVSPMLCKGDVSTVYLELQGGKTHQLRAQLADWGHFILGDGKYGDDRINRQMGCTKQQLTAIRIVMPTMVELPSVSGKVIELPKKLQTIGVGTRK